MKILIIEDEDNLRKTMTASLEKERFVVEYASDFQTARYKLNDYDYDCILLDIMLPDGNGLTLLQELKKMHKKESVIIISAKDSIEDKVYGLDLGADDYLSKPFHLAELHARVKSVIRRKQNGGDLKIELENLNVYPDRHAVFIGDQELILNRKEFDLLYYFVTNPGRLIHKGTLAEAVWGDCIDQADNYDFIYSQVKNLRKKMKSAGALPEIRAVYGFGYKMCRSNQLPDT
ncbi:response regulator transcription factor [uncultured Odoribacter sp.]|mgnify:CR=1 FL=1|uniref:response regulator transcription factor n=1 Tax=uncultured Odoribacter sp. TaxID=876416 RepID=UPI00262B02FB|nr:response regulator transcription factor [uncultured Odoribacter sp.]